MHRLYLILFFSFCLGTFSQSKKITKVGIVTFEASVPSFEEVKATSNSVSCILNTQNGEIAALALMKGFRFKVALMEEHFNENYIESTKYPKAIFKGKIENFDGTKLSEEQKKYTIKGTLELHGEVKKITSIAYIKKTGATIEIKNTFEVSSDDFTIKIPKIVSNKVSKRVHINCSFILQ
jgi:hypothetical protein